MPLSTTKLLKLQKGENDLEFKQAVVTQNGRALMAKLLAGKSTQFTKIKVSSTIYQDGQLENLTALTNINQETTAQAYGNNTATVSVVGAIENTGLQTGYYINTVGLYAVDPDKGEILYSVSSASVNGYMPPDTGVSKSGFEFKIYTEVGNATKVDLTVDPAAFATHEDIERLDVQQAWMSENDGEGFTFIKPEENLILGSSDWSTGKRGGYTEKLTGEEGYKGHDILKTQNVELAAYADTWATSINNLASYESVTLSFKAKSNVDNTQIVFFFNNPNTTISSLTSQGKKGTNAEGITTLNLSTEWENYWITWKQTPAQGSKSLILGRIFDSTGTKMVCFTMPKLEVGENVYPVYSPSSKDDPINCHPKYIGFGIKSSDNYQDYRWILNPEWVNANAMYGISIVTMKDQLADIQDWIQAHS